MEDEVQEDETSRKYKAGTMCAGFSFMCRTGVDPEILAIKTILRGTRRFVDTLSKIFYFSAHSSSHVG